MRYHMNKMGLVDFWFYQDEEFEFENGHMLLRGNNGSGKSVTLQSFIPLLLDGDRRSERIDPFGTRSRKMETYLIDENSTRNERIGYLYLEFKKEDHYITIGMGLRARKGKKLESWYFILNNKRIRKDIRLVKDGLTLSKDQLKKELKEEFIENQNEYMKRVNELLFGFDNVNDYKDAIDLLLKLRSPKLSNSLTPIELSELLQGSLQPISDSELRQMSEAIDDMDELQDKLAVLKDSLDAARKMNHAYSQYNKSLLLEKYMKYNHIVEECKNKEKELNQLKKEIEKNRKENEYNQQLLKDTMIKKAASIEEQNQLQNNNIHELVSKVNELYKQLQEINKDINKSEDLYEKKENRYFDKEKQYEKQKNDLYNLEKECKSLLSELDEYDEYVHFIDHIRIMKSYEHNDYIDFNHINELIEDIKSKANTLLNQYHEYELVSKNREDLSNQKELLVEEGEKITLHIEELSQLYTSTCNDIYEEYLAYSSNNTYIKFSLEEINTIHECIKDYEHHHSFNSINRILEQLYVHNNSEMTLALKQQEKLYEELETAYNNVCKEYDELEHQEDVVVEESDEVIKFRQYLDECHIAYKPLYQLMEFKDIDDKMKDSLEEGLAVVGLLDAIVVNKNSQFEELPLGIKDYIIYTDQEVENLDLFYIGDYADIEAMLQYLTNTTTTIHISNRHIHTDLYDAYITGTIPAKYIGYKQRLETKRKMLEALNKQKEDYIIQIDMCKKHIVDLNNELSNLLEEYNHRISDDKLKNILEDIDSHQKDYDKIQLEIQRIIENIHIYQHKLNELSMMIKKCSQELDIHIGKDVLEEYIKDFDIYAKKVRAYIHAYRDLLNAREKEASLLEYLQQLEDDLMEYKIGLDQLKDTHQQTKTLYDSLSKQVKDAGYEQMIQRIHILEDMIKQYNHTIDECKYKITRFETLLESDHQNVLKKEEELKASIESKQLYYEIVEEEVNYHLVINSMDDLNEGLIDSLYKEVGNKKANDYYQSFYSIFLEQNDRLHDYALTREQKSICHDIDSFTNRIIIRAYTLNKKVPLSSLVEFLEKAIEEQNLLIDDKDRQIFEQILINSLSETIRKRIHESYRWVNKIQGFMQDVRTSSGLSLSLQWKACDKDEDSDLSIKELVDLFEKDYHILTEQDKRRISNHFKAKIKSARERSKDENNTESFNALINEILDYRKWFEFVIYASKPNEVKRELTKSRFQTYSGGEKALSMYIPLFSAVAAKFKTNREDAPLVIALDEAFAGVDENNIDEMFALITKFDFDYIMNSQVLWGDYPSCKSLAIYELFRDPNANIITTFRYKWNGYIRESVMDGLF